MAGDFKRLLEEFRARPLYDEEEAKAAQAADRQQARGARVRESLGGVSDALYSAFTRTPVAPMRSLTALPSTADALANRQRGAGMEQDRRLRIAEAGHRVETDEGKRQALASVLPDVGRAYGLPDDVLGRLSPDNMVAVLGAQGAKLAREAAAKKATAEASERTRQASRQQAQLTETQRHNRAMEAKSPTPPYVVVTGEGGRQYFADPRNPTAPAVPLAGPDGSPLAKPGKGNVPRTLSGEQTAQMAGYDTADGALDQVLADFNGMAGGMTSAGTQYIPNTGASQYNKVRDGVAQTVGIILEGGKLTDGDRDFYKNMLPAPGDSQETANLKVQKLRTLMQAKRKAELDALDASGFEVGGFRKGQPAQGGSFDMGAPQASFPTGAAPTDEDSAAVQWARQNPNDPRAAAILQANGVTP